MEGATTWLIESSRLEDAHVKNGGVASSSYVEKGEECLAGMSWNEEDDSKRCTQASRIFGSTLGVWSGVRPEARRKRCCHVMGWNWRSILVFPEAQNECLEKCVKQLIHGLGPVEAATCKMERRPRLKQNSEKEE
ncbi:hypothetical protein LR48_Vigan08g032700 [Vigna angularis]|uniref:Uncharacterized protein n=1 Tax=Phaseolus angularis TaxID=3914 RepID=A0A0L9V383_PHAAN|nr:hypothetical protein LR48_Vigan08g032700 [Vigna angularis]